MHQICWNFLVVGWILSFFSIIITIIFSSETKIVSLIEYEYSHGHKILSDCTILTHLSSFNIRLHSLHALKQFVNWRRYRSERIKNIKKKDLKKKVNQTKSQIIHEMYVMFVLYMSAALFNRHNHNT